MSGAASVSKGLSPRVRGSQRRYALPLATRRSIPAGAGEPIGTVRVPAVGRVYPRGCGGAFDAVFLPQCLHGLSPRVRGSLPMQSTFPCQMRSIPAGAGEPWTSLNLATTITVYPRGCGGADFNADVSPSQIGLSPRVRGSQFVHRATIAHYGSIPAGAGEPIASTKARSPRQVYPRGCGGAVSYGARPRLSLGLSPRVRGSPTRIGSSGAMGEVYPRGCGGANAWQSRTRLSPGLSPRVRGSRFQRRCIAVPNRSIPAGAGEPGVEHHG